FAQATGVASIITRTNGGPITQPSNFCRLCIDIIRKTEKGLKNCFKSDSILGRHNPDGPKVQTCFSGGLWDAGAAISVSGVHIANWLIGQVRNEAQTEDQMRRYAHEIEADEEAVVQAFREVPAMSREQFQKVAQALFTLANQLSANAFQNLQQARFIAERKSAETALRESETRFRNMFEQAPLSYQSLDEHGNFTAVNQTWLHTMGYTREEVLGKNFSEFLKPEWRGHFEENFPRFKAVGEMLGVEFEMVKKNGATILVSFHGKIGKDEKGNFDRTHCVFRNVSLEKSAADTLKREAELNRAIADISKELLSEIYDITRVSKVTLKYAQELTGSAHGFVSSVDKTTLENVGHTLTDMYGEKCRMKDQRIVFPIGPDGKYNALWGHALNIKQSFFTNQPATHTSAKGVPAGHIRLENYIAVPVIIEDTISGMIALANADRDYTDSDIDTVERLADIFALALHRHRYELEKQAMEDQLQQMQKLEAIGTLAGGIAHDFNNILFPIVGMSEMLLEDLPPDSLEWENADEIFRAGKRGSDLVKQILAFSRQTEHRIAPLRIQSILKEVVKLVRSTIPTNITIVHNLQVDCGLVLADPTQLHQVAMNLITNAFHAVELTGGQIDILLAETTLKEGDLENSLLKPGAYAQITVSDTGGGMEPAVLEKIFEPYFTTKAQGKGTGLGLAVVHGIITEFQGDIQVVSQIGLGTAFYIYLPLLKHKEAAARSEISTVLDTGTGHILLVDDEKAIVQLERQMLERLGYRVTTRLNSVDALEAFRANPAAYDLVITDMAMPNLTGDLLSKELMAIRADLPVIICTGFSERINDDRILEIGAKGLLSKPVVKSDLARMVKAVLDEARGAEL
ncbi:MAG: response regulator, partial [Desulfobacterales bacterium]|nr:response regulator [Desulfobacterales bacterium]